MTDLPSQPFSDAHALQAAGLIEYATLVQRVMLSHGLRWRAIYPEWTPGRLAKNLRVVREDRREFLLPVGLDTPELHTEIRKVATP